MKDSLDPQIYKSNEGRNKEIAEIEDNGKAGDDKAKHQAILTAKDMDKLTDNFNALLKTVSEFKENYKDTIRQVKKDKKEKEKKKKKKQ